MRFSFRQHCRVGAFFVFAATQTFSEVNFWLEKGMTLLFSTGLTAWTIYRTEFEGIKILFWQL